MLTIFFPHRSFEAILKTCSSKGSKPFSAIDPILKKCGKKKQPRGLSKEDYRLQHRTLLSSLTPHQWQTAQLLPDHYSTAPGMLFPLGLRWSPSCHILVIEFPDCFASSCHKGALPLHYKDIPNTAQSL